MKEDVQFVNPVRDGIGQCGLFQALSRRLGKFEFFQVYWRKVQKKNNGKLSST